MFGSVSEPVSVGSHGHEAGRTWLTSYKNPWLHSRIVSDAVAAAASLPIEVAGLTLAQSWHRPRTAR